MTCPAPCGNMMKARREILLSEALDHTNRIFQLTHMCGAVGTKRALLDSLAARSGITDPRGVARLRVELANYFAAAVLMPYDAFLAEARATKYDLDHIATRFGVSFEQACHRATTLQREGAQGVPFFFPADRQGRQRDQTVQRDRLSSGRTWRGLPAAGCAYVVPHAGADRAAIRGNAGPVAVFRVFPHRGPPDMGPACAGQPPCRGDGLCAIEHAPEIGYAEAFSVAPGHADDAGRDQLPHLPAFWLRPARASGGGAVTAGG
jgi:XRE family transcriptional regulator, fatty acid utilization regulator